MNFTKANTVDILRCSQKDEQYTDLTAKHLFDIVRLCGNKHNKLTETIHPLAQFLYYSLTSLSNLQTLGEEYAGTLRFNRQQKNIPNKLIHIIWLLFFIGGEKVVNGCLNHCERRFKKNTSFTAEAKESLLKSVQFLKSNKDILLRFNQALFYIDGKYYYVSNRSTKIQYIFLRSWSGEDNPTQIMKFLGRMSFLYLICAVLHKTYSTNYQLTYDSLNENQDDYHTMTSEICYVCTKIKTHPSALSCGHVFCWECIFNTIAYEAKCPTCREPINSNRIILLQNY